MVEAVLSLYEDAKCTKELNKKADNYELLFDLVNSNTSILKKNYYIKNTGNHSAFNITVLTSNNKYITTKLSNKELNVNEICTLSLTLNTYKNVNIFETITVSINFSNI